MTRPKRTTRGPTAYPPRDVSAEAGPADRVYLSHATEDPRWDSFLAGLPGDILHNILGQIDGFAAVGELRYIWGRAAIDNQLCGCGERFRNCPFWDEVMTHAFGGLDLASRRSDPRRGGEPAPRPSAVGCAAAPVVNDELPYTRTRSRCRRPAGRGRQPRPGWSLMRVVHIGWAWT